MSDGASSIHFEPVRVSLVPWRICSGVCGGIEYYVYVGSPHEAAGGQGKNESETHCSAECEKESAAEDARLAAIFGD